MDMYLLYAAGLFSVSLC